MEPWNNSRRPCIALFRGSLDEELDTMICDALHEAARGGTTIGMGWGHQQEQERRIAPGAADVPVKREPHLDSYGQSSIDAVPFRSSRPTCTVRPSSMPLTSSMYTASEANPGAGLRLTGIASGAPATEYARSISTIGLPSGIMNSIGAFPSNLSSLAGGDANYVYQRSAVLPQQQLLPVYISDLNTGSTSRPHSQPLMRSSADPAPSPRLDSQSQPLPQQIGQVLAVMPTATQPPSRQAGATAGVGSGYQLHFYKVPEMPVHKPHFSTNSRVRYKVQEKELELQQKIQHLTVRMPKGCKP